MIVSEQCYLQKKDDADRLSASEESVHVVWPQDYENKHNVYFDETESDAYYVGNSEIPDE